MKDSISVLIIARNEESRLRACLNQARKLAADIIIVDDESTDATRLIAESEYGARVLVRRSGGHFGSQRNAGAELVRTPWFFNMDADEVLPDGDIAAIHAALAAADDKVAAFRIKRLNYFFDKPIRHAGAFFPLLKIFRSDCRDRGVVHEEWDIPGTVRDINAVVHHYPFTSMTALFQRIILYTAKEAEAYVAARARVPFRDIRNGITGHSLKLFWKLYVKKQGWRDGPAGFMFCAQNVLGPAIRWCMIWDEARRQGKLS